MAELWEELASAVAGAGVAVEPGTGPVRDASPARGTAQAVVRPRDARGVAAVITWAAGRGVPIVPFGGGTGLAGGAVPQGGILLRCDGLHEPFEVDARRRLARVGAGVIHDELAAEAARTALFLPPRPGSADAATIGGNVATNAAGPRSFKYGATRVFVAALEVVTGAGEILVLGAETAKRATGPDLVQLFVGSEGALGVITSAVLRLVPEPPARALLVASFPDTGVLQRGLDACLALPFRPAAVEYVGAEAVAVLREAGRRELPEGEYLLVEFEGRPVAISEEAEDAASALERAGGRAEALAADGRDLQRLWSWRLEVPRLLSVRHPHRLSEDATVPLDRVGSFVDRARRVAAAFDVPFAVFGHAGDGNLHPNLLVDDPRSPAAREAFTGVLRAALDEGGVLSGEHGIGLLKAPLFAEAVGEASVRHLRAIKRVFDPVGILNPGKVLGNDPPPLRSSPPGIGIESYER